MGSPPRCTRLRGAIIELPYPSVGATESALLSAAHGRRQVGHSRGAATEPEVLELALFLQRMGARIELRPDRRIVIEGVAELRGARTRLQGDRNEAFSYLVAGLLTGGRGSGRRLRPGPAGHRHHHLDADGRPGGCRRPGHDGVGARRPAGGRGADRGSSRFHDRLADPADGALHPGRRHVGAARDGLRGPLRVRTRPAADGRRDRAVRQLSGRPGLPVPRDQQPPLGGGARGVQAPRAPRWRFPTCGPASRASSPRPPPRDPRCFGASTIWSGATTARPNNCAPWGWT